MEPKELPNQTPIRLIDCNALAERLNVQPCTVRAWRHRERLPKQYVYKIGSCVRFDERIINAITQNGLCSVEKAKPSKTEK